MRSIAPPNEGDFVEKKRKPDPRIARTKQLLAQSLRQLLGDQCFEDITIQDILDKSTINRATFYAHFDDKDALLHFILDNIFEESLAERLPSSAPATSRNLDQLVLAVCDFLGKVRRCSKLTTIEGNPHVEAAMKPGVHRIIGGWLRKMDQGPDFDAELAAAAASWTLCGAAMAWNRWNCSEPVVSAEDFLTRLKPLLETSVGPKLAGTAPEEKPVLAYPYFADEVGMI